MKQGLALFLIFMMLLVLGCGSVKETTVKEQEKEKAYQVVDVTGETVMFSQKPQRIITLSASTDEIILGMLPTDKLVAINFLLDDPASSNIVNQAQKIPNKIKDPSAEYIFSLKPDVVIVPDWVSADIVSSLKSLGLKVFICKGSRSVAEVRETVDLLSQVVGEEEKGRQIIQQMDEKLQEIKVKVDKIPVDQRKKVVLISLMTTYGGIGSTFDDMCHYAGVINGLAAIGIKNGEPLGKEGLLKVNPDILIMPVYNDHGNFDIEAFRNEYLLDPSLQTLPAVKEKKLYFPREGYLYNASQDIVYGIQEIALAVYGDAFAQAGTCHISVSGE
ncbi:MAG: ABC transporter substrate-binding protein [Sporomusaceae bacterium]|nr:ABC transporter substrate-binding protein [Sporomusaceae bacterium]